MKTKFLTWLGICLLLLSLGTTAFASSLEDHFELKWWNDVSTMDESKSYLMVDTYHQGRTLASLVYPDLGEVVFILDEKGEELPVGYFYFARPFSDGYAWVQGQLENEQYFLDLQGEFLPDVFGNYALSYNYSQGSVLAFTHDWEGVLLDVRGQETAGIKYPLSAGISEGLIPTYGEDQEKIVYMTAQGEPQFTLSGIEGDDFFQGFSWITTEILTKDEISAPINRLKVLVDQHGNILSPEQVNGGSLYYAGHDLLLLSHNERLNYTPYYGLYDTKMKELIPMVNLALSSPLKDKIWYLQHQEQEAFIGYYDEAWNPVQSGSFTMPEEDSPLYTLSPDYKLTTQGSLYKIAQEKGEPNFVLYTSQGKLLRQDKNVIAGLISDENGIFYVYHVDSGITEIVDEKGKTIMKEEMQPLRAIPGYAATIEDLPLFEGNFKEIMTPLLHDQEGGYGLVFQKQNQSEKYPFTYSSYFFMDHFFFKDGFWGMVDKYGRWYIEPQLDEVPKFNPNQSLVVFKKEQIWGRGEFLEKAPRFRLRPDEKEEVKR